MSLKVEPEQLDMQVRNTFKMNNLLRQWVTERQTKMW